MLSSNIVQLKVVINASGHPVRTLRNVTSILEIPDEVNETIGSISFYSGGHWHNIKATEFGRITIEHEPRTCSINKER